jgi:transcriptional regulator GlxA family with amidase domain
VLIDVVVFDGFDELDALGPVEVFRSAAALGGEVSARLVTLSAQEVVVGAHGISVVPDGVLEVGAADVLVVVGGGWAVRAERGAWGEVQRGEALPVLAEAAAASRIVAGVCTGTMLLAHAGAVGSRRAGTHHTAWDDLAATGATVVRDRVVDDGDLITCGGVTSGIDLALWLVERECGRELAEQVAAILEYARAVPVR